MRVLFTNAGRRTYLVQYALDLAARDYPVEIFVSDSTIDAAALHVSPDARTILLPRVDSGEDIYMAALRDAVAKHRIDVIIPLSDFDIDALARAKDDFAHRGVTAVVGKPDIVARATDKRRADEFCRAAGLPTPESAFATEDYRGRFPCMVKKIHGSAGHGQYVADGPDGLRDFIAGADMIQKFVDGTEYGIDILNDLQGRFVAACVKRKLSMRAGETDRAEIVDHPGIFSLAEKIGTALGHVGNLDVDVMEDRNGGLYCIDFNPRFGGGYPATHAAGLNFLQAVLDMTAGRPVSLPDAPRPVTIAKGISIHPFERS